jgi:uncharacterized protein (DUF4415 family)
MKRKQSKTLRIDIALWNKFNELRFKTGKSIQAQAEEAVREYLKRNKIK